MDDLGCSSNIENMSAKKQKIPLINMDLHYYAHRMINRLIDENLLPKTGNKVIRFDAHRDELIPEDMSPLFPMRVKSIRRGMYREYGTEIWMKEAVDEEGSLENIIWVKPPWAMQVEDGHRTLENGVTIDVKTIGKSIFETGEEDYEGFKTLITKYIGPNDPYVIDLAFCFFSADNPFAETYDKSETFYKIMKDLFKVPMPVSNEDTDVENAVKERYEQLDELRKIFYFLHENRTLPDPVNYPEEIFKMVAEIKEELLIHYSDDEIKWNYIYEDGVCASDYLSPVHHTSRDDIKKLIECVGRVLDNLQNPPALIILGVMYDYDRYAPKKDLEFITNSLNEFFKSRYDINIEYLDY